MVLLAALMTSCIKKTIPPDDSVLGLEYYPLIPGRFIVYDVDSTVYTEIPKDTISYRYRIKEVLADTFTDNVGQTAWRIERFIKRYDPFHSYDSIPWTSKEAWMLNATNRSIQIVEHNIRYTNLVFPIEDQVSWNGHAHNSLGEQKFSYDYIDRNEIVGMKNFEDVLKVKQLYFPTLISHQDYSEKYAKGVGLVSREITDLLSNKIVPGKEVKDRIESGIIYKQTYVTHGIESN